MLRVPALLAGFGMFQVKTTIGRREPDLVAAVDSIERVADVDYELKVRCAILGGIVNYLSIFVNRC